MAVGAVVGVEPLSPHATPITINAAMPIVVTRPLFTFISCSRSFLFLYSCMCALVVMGPFTHLIHLYTDMISSEINRSEP